MNPEGLLRDTEQPEGGTCKLCQGSMHVTSTSVNKERYLADIHKQYSLSPPSACLDENVLHCFSLRNELH